MDVTLTSMHIFALSIIILKHWMYALLFDTQTCSSMSCLCEKPCHIHWNLCIIRLNLRQKLYVERTTICTSGELKMNANETRQKIETKIIKHDVSSWDRVKFAYLIGGFVLYMFSCPIGESTQHTRTLWECLKLLVAAASTTHTLAYTRSQMNVIH